MKTIHHRLLFILCLSVALLAGCDRFDTPEAAAIDLLVRQGIQGMTIDRATLTALDQGQVGDFHPVVLVFNATRVGKGPERCVYVYNAEQENLRGWSSTGGWGLCRDLSDPDAPPISIGGGVTFNEDDGAPDLSTSSGLVLDDRITEVEVIWKDGLTERVPVTSGAYFSAREGQFDLQNVRAYDADGQLVYSQE